MAEEIERESPNRLQPLHRTTLLMLCPVLEAQKVVLCFHGILHRTRDTGHQDNSAPRYKNSDSINNSNVNDDSDSASKALTRDMKFDDKRTFKEELDQHKNSIVWAFDYGEEVAKKTEENIHAYQKKFLAKYFMLTDKSPSAESSPIDFTNPIEAQPSTSKQIVDQKTPHSEKRIDTTIRKRTRCSENGGDAWTPQRSRETPLPMLPWANSAEVWQTMVYKEEATSRTRNCRLFEDPCSFLPRMRAILIDWIMEVCEVYHLRRVTYYLAVDYIDRFLTIKPTVPKHQLQLIGISSLFIAAKLEEIYPPKLSEFSYVCDGACSNEDILECEILLLNTLGWDVNPMTPTGWLNLYMQIYFDTKKATNSNEHASCDFFYPQYSAYQFVLASHLIDLFSLDPGFLLFSYSIIAAGAMYFLFGRTTALRVSGLEWSDLKDCTEYMAVFYSIIRDTHDPRLQTIITRESDDRQEATYNSLRVWIPTLTPDEHHSVQTHVIDLKYFEKATLLRLHRMGLRVRKTVMKKSSQLVKAQAQCETDEKPVSNSYHSEEEVEQPNPESEDPPLVLFEIEKILDMDNEKQNSFNCSSGNDAEFFASKTKYTFDEILIGINDCTNKTLLPRRLGQDIQINNKDDLE